MATEYTRAFEVEEIACKLIELFHEHLLGATIRYVFSSRLPMVDKKPKAAVAKLIVGLNCYLSSGSTEPYFCIVVGIPAWDELSVEQRIALVDHELSHCGFDTDTDNPAIIEHDVEEFSSIVERHGAWHDQLIKFSHSLKRGEDGAKDRQEMIQQILNG